MRLETEVPYLYDLVVGGTLSLSSHTQNSVNEVMMSLMLIRLQKNMVYFDVVEVAWIYVLLGM